MIKNIILTLGLGINMKNNLILGLECARPLTYPQG